MVNIMEISELWIDQSESRISQSRVIKIFKMSDIVFHWGEKNFEG